MRRKTDQKPITTSEVVATAVLAIAATLTLIKWCGRLNSPRLWDYSTVLAVSARVADGGVLYRDFRDPPSFPTQYGPLVPIVTGHLESGHDTLTVLKAGRVLTISSTLLVSALIFALSLSSGATRVGSILAALAFMASPLVQQAGFEYRVDMPALALNLGGLWAFESGLAPAAIPFFVAAFFVKQGQFYGIAAVLLALAFRRDFSRAVRIGVAWAMLVTLIVAAIEFASPYYWLNTFGVAGGYLDATAPLSFLRQNAIHNAFLLLLAAVSISRFGSNVFTWLLLAAIIENSALSLRWGSNVYYYLPTVAAAAILASRALDLCFEKARAWSRPVQIACGALLSFGLLSGLVDGKSYRAIASGNPPRMTSWSDQDDVSRRCVSGYWDAGQLRMLESMTGTIVTDSLELTLVDRRPNVDFIELMALRAMESQGTFDDAALIRSIREHKVSAFVLSPEGLNKAYRGRDFFWPRLRKAIDDNYEPIPSKCPPVVMIPKGRNLQINDRGDSFPGTASGSNSRFGTSEFQLLSELRKSHAE